MASEDEYSGLISQQLLHALTAATTVMKDTNDLLKNYFDESDNAEGGDYI